MSLTSQQPVYSNPSGDGQTIQVKVGPRTYFFEMQKIRDILSGRVENIDYLICQALLILRANGTDPNNLAASAAVLNSNPIWWI